MSARKTTFRLLLPALVVGMGLGASAGLTTRPLHASSIPPGGGGPDGHSDWIGFWWCHCGGTPDCGPCSTEPPQQSEQ